MKTAPTRICLAFFALFGLLHASLAQSHKIVFTPQWMPQSQFAGYYVAHKLGFYKEKGLEVEFRYAKASDASVNSLKQNQSQVITLMLPQALKECDEGNQLVNLLQTSQNSSLVLISHPDNPLNQIDQFKNIRIGYFKAGFNELAEALNRAEKLEWRPVHFEQSFNLLLFGAIDATVGMEYNELQQVIYSGMEVSDKNVFRFDENGYNIPEDGLYTTKACYEAHKKQMDDFAEASRKGWEWTRQHPDKALDIVMEQIEQNQRLTSRVLQKKELEIILKAQINRKENKATYRLSLQDFEQAVRTLRIAGLINGNINYQSFIGK